MTLLTSEIEIAAASEDRRGLPVARAGLEGRIVIPGLFDVTHHFEIDPLAGDRSRLRQFEHFSGVLVPFMHGMLRDTQAAFALANQAIKQRADSAGANRARTEAG